MTINVPDANDPVADQLQMNGDARGQPVSDNHMEATNDAAGDDDDEDEEIAAWRNLASGPTTPNITETVESLKRTLSISGIQELVNRPPAEMRRSIQNKLWRPSNEKARMPHDWERLVVHVVRAGARAFVLAYGLRSLVSFLLALISSVRSRKYQRAAVRSAFLGEATARFALTFGVWAALYKAVHNSLRLLTPPPSGRKSGARATFDVQANQGTPKGTDKWTRQRFLFRPDPRSKVWHAYVAGAVSSLALLLQDTSFYRGFAPQLFVRGLEGTFRLASSHGLIHIPHGDVLTFGIANVIIMSTWCSHDEDLPRSYKVWIDRASRIPLPYRDVYKSTTYGNGADPWKLASLFPGGQLPEGAMQDPPVFSAMGPTKYNPYGVSKDAVALMHRWFYYGDPDRVNCVMAHPHTTNHLYAFTEVFASVWKRIMPVYLTLYLVPSLFLRPSAFLKDPKKSLLRIILGASRSSAFLGLYNVLFQGLFCIMHSTYETIYFNNTLRNIPGLLWFGRVITHDRLKILPGFATCLSLFVEPQHRRGDLSAYVLPKALQTFWTTGRRYGYLPHVPGGDFILASIGLSLIMGTYATNPEDLSRIVSRVVYQFVGRN